MGSYSVLLLLVCLLNSTCAQDSKSNAATTEGNDVQEEFTVTLGPPRDGVQRAVMDEVGPTDIVISASIDDVPQFHPGDNNAYDDNFVDIREEHELFIPKPYRNESKTKTTTTQRPRTVGRTMAPPRITQAPRPAHTQAPPRVQPPQFGRPQPRPQQPRPQQPFPQPRPVQRPQQPLPQPRPLPVPQPPRAQPRPQPVQTVPQPQRPPQPAVTRPAPTASRPQPTLPPVPRVPQQPIRPQPQPPHTPPRFQPAPSQGTQPDKNVRTGVCHASIFYISSPLQTQSRLSFTHFAIAVSVDQCARTCHEFTCAIAHFDPSNGHCQFNPTSALAVREGQCPRWPAPVHYRNNVVARGAIRIFCVQCHRPFRRGRGRTHRGRFRTKVVSTQFTGRTPSKARGVARGSKRFEPEVVGDAASGIMKGQILRQHESAAVTDDKLMVDVSALEDMMSEISEKSSIRTQRTLSSSSVVSEQSSGAETESH